ncbi:hypothetical protein M1116_02255 [Patescibacteria group bacterium]|nr:hypothetical protein [Patescibacteria group bacterium]
MHRAKLCVISCIDFRIQEALVHYLNSQGYQHNYDLISMAGASRDLVKPIQEEDRAAIIRQIKLSLRLHQPEEIWVFDHQDCGGYAQDKTIVHDLPVEADRQAHMEFSRILLAEIRKLDNKRPVKYFLIDLWGGVSELPLK